MTDPIRVVIADDHPMFRDGLRAALHAIAEIDVVGDAANGEQLLELVEATSPDVVLTDLAMPALDGVAAAQRIRELHPEVKVLMLTMHDDDTALRQALQAGARGYLLKDSDRDSIVLAVRAVAAGGTFYGQRVGDRISTWASDPPAPARGTVPVPDPTRERDPRPGRPRHRQPRDRPPADAVGEDDPEQLRLHPHQTPGQRPRDRRRESTRRRPRTTPLARPDGPPAQAPSVPRSGRARRPDVRAAHP